MYKILFFLITFSSVLFSQSWQNTMTLNTGLSFYLQNTGRFIFTNQTYAAYKVKRQINYVFKKDLRKSLNTVPMHSHRDFFIYRFSKDK